MSGASVRCEPKLNVCDQVFTEAPNIKLNGNVSSRSQDDSCGQTDDTAKRRLSRLTERTQTWRTDGRIFHTGVNDVTVRQHCGNVRRSESKERFGTVYVLCHGQHSWRLLLTQHTACFLVL